MTVGQLIVIYNFIRISYFTETLLSKCLDIFVIFTSHFYPTALKGCVGIVFTHGVRMGGQTVGKSLSGL